MNSRPRGQRESIFPSLNFAGGRQQFYWRLRCQRLNRNWAWRPTYLFGIPHHFVLNITGSFVCRGCAVGARRGLPVEVVIMVRLRQGSDGLHYVQEGLPELHTASDVTV